MDEQKKVIIGLSCVRCGPGSKWVWSHRPAGKIYACECGETQYNLIFAQYENSKLCKRTMYSITGEIRELESQTS